MDNKGMLYVGVIGFGALACLCLALLCRKQNKLKAHMHSGGQPDGASIPPTNPEAQERYRLYAELIANAAPSCLAEQIVYAKALFRQIQAHFEAQENEKALQLYGLFSGLPVFPVIERLHANATLLMLQKCLDKRDDAAARKYYALLREFNTTPAVQKMVSYAIYRLAEFYIHNNRPVLCYELFDDINDLSGKSEELYTNISNIFRWLILHDLHKPAVVLVQVYDLLRRLPPFPKVELAQIETTPYIMKVYLTTENRQKIEEAHSWLSLLAPTDASLKALTKATTVLVEYYISVGDKAKAIRQLEIFSRLRKEACHFAEYAQSLHALITAFKASDDEHTASELFSLLLSLPRIDAVQQAIQQLEKNGAVS